MQSGVPQGSTQGPYLFVAFMGSVAATHVDKNIVMYADDLTMIENVTGDYTSHIPKWRSSLPFRACADGRYGSIFRSATYCVSEGRLVITVKKNELLMR